MSLETKDNDKTNALATVGSGLMAEDCFKKLEWYWLELSPDN